jgi:ribosomal protein S15
MEAKLKTIGDFRVHERDTGSADVQIALLTRRINHLTEHLQKNAKDHSSRLHSAPDSDQGLTEIAPGLGGHGSV